MRNRRLPPFTSALTKREAICVLLWLPVHLVLLPLALGLIAKKTGMSENVANFLVYGIGTVYLLAVAFRFLRRDFDPLADAPLRCLAEVVWAYVAMMAFNLVLASLLLHFLPDSENPNNAEVTALVLNDSGPMKAAVMIFAPIVEELMFRAGIFGLLRRRSRFWAYAVSMILFAGYHVVSYALVDPIYLVYLLQYLPVAWLLARCYERTNTIWGSIFFHMAVNTIAVNTLITLQEYL